MGRFVDQGYQSKYNGGDNPIFEMSERELLRTFVIELCNLSDKLDGVNKRLDMIMDRDNEGYYNLGNVVHQMSTVSKDLNKIESATDRVTRIPDKPDHFQGIHNVINVLNRIEKKIDQLDNE